jgi:carnitine O-palmitoyltransferase 1
MEVQIQRILDDKALPDEGEEKLAALTAGARATWCNARKKYFSKGINKVSLDVIETAAFVLVLDLEPLEFDPADPRKLDTFGRRLLHGRGYDRWFDKSFNLIVGSNGKVGFNAEHSW